MTILDLFFPKICLECKKEGKYICRDCLRKVKKNGWNSDWVYSIWKNEGVIKKAINALKCKYSTEIAKELVEVSVKRLKKDGLDLEDMTLFPIPLHWYRENIRGFNQSELVGKEIAKKMGWKYISDLLLSKNKKGVFELNPKYANKVPLRVIIFDDVLITGSTLLEASGVLRGRGVERVLCLIIAN